MKDKFISSGGTGIGSLNATHFVDIDEELELAIYFGNDKERYLKEFGIEGLSCVTQIGTDCFYLCSNLTSVTCKAITPPTLGYDVFKSTPIASGNGHIYVPSASVNAYKSASGWSDYASRIQAIT